MNVWFCLAVIFIHIVSDALYGDFSPIESSDKAYTILFILFKLSIYVVQGFVFLSALKFFLKYRDAKLNYIKFLWSRIYKIIIPYIIWFFIYVMYFNYRPDYTLDGTDIPKALWQCTLVSHFYFIAIITQLYVLMPLWLLLFKKISAAVMLPASLFVNILVLYMIPDLYYYYSGGQSFALNSHLFTSYIFFWCAGAYTGLNYEKVTDCITKHTFIIAAAAVVSGAATGLYNYIVSAENHVMYFTDILYMLYQISVIFLLLAVFSRIYRRGGRPPLVIRCISASSYSIYLAHILFIYAAEFYCSRHGISSSYAVFGCRCLAAYGVCITLCVLFGVIKRLFRKLLHKKQTA